MLQGWSLRAAVLVVCLAVLPTALAAISGPTTDDDGTYTITWTGSYSLFENGVRVASASPYQAIDKPDGTYVYRLWHCFTEGRSRTCEFTNDIHEVVVERPAVPPTPASISAAPGIGPDVDIVWSAVAEATSYTLEHDRSVDGGASWQGWNPTTSTSATSHVHGVTASGAYRYRVNACNAVGCSGWTTSNTVSVALAPGVPSGLVASSNPAPDGVFTLSWSAPSGTVTAYTLQERPSSGAWSTIYSGSAVFHDVNGRPEGSYDYQVRACNGADCSAFTAPLTVEAIAPVASGPATPAAPQLAPIPAPDPNSQQVGTTAGSFGVSESGAATYSIPIVTSGGIAGVAPQLSLNYSSDGGNGPLGVAWSIGGLSAITRCRQTWETDQAQGGINLDEHDRFCLDGQRLVLVSGTTYGAPGTEYRTEIDSFAKIVAVGGSAADGPDHFEVYRKDGSRSLYGGTMDSRQEAPGTGKAVTWAISRFEDSVSRASTTPLNPIEFIYFEDTATGEHHIERIEFENGQSRVKFLWEARNDERTSYLAGSSFNLTQRLKQIESEVQSDAGWAQLRSYLLAYETPEPSGQSQIVEIRECVGTICLQPTRFTWSNPAYAFGNEAPSGLLFQYRGGRPLDFDGDGDMDLAYVLGNMDADGSSNFYFRLARSTPNGLVDVDIGQFQPHAGSDQRSSWQVIDYNLDGYQDLIYVHEGFWKVQLLGLNPVDNLISTGIPTADIEETAVFMDISGDGLPDAVQGTKVRYGVQGPTGLSFSVPYLVTFTDLPDEPSLGYNQRTIGFAEAVKGDFNGDGLMDTKLVVTDECEADWEYTEPLPPVCDGATSYYYRRHFIAVRQAGSGFSPTSGGIEFKVVAEMEVDLSGDFNGDGLTDLVAKEGTQLQLHLANGVNFDPGPVLDVDSNPSDGLDLIDHVSIVDFNGDGRSDVVVPSSATATANMRVRLYGADGWEPSWQDTGLVNGDLQTDGGARHLFLDLNGDGTKDHLRITHNGYSHRAMRGDAFVASGVINQVTDGYGASIGIEYAALTDSDAGVYTKATAGSTRLLDYGNGSPVFDMFGPLYVVARVERSAPAGGMSPGLVDTSATIASSFEYVAGRSQAGGRGFLGFLSLTTTDESTGVTTATEYRQDFPFAGIPEATEVRTGADILMSRATNQLVDEAPAGAPRRPYVQRSEEFTYDPFASSSEPLITVITDMSQDAYGNVISMTVTTSGGDDEGSVSTTNTYADNVDEWHLGRLVSTSVRYARVGDPGCEDCVVDRHSTFDYDSASGQLVKESIEPTGGAEEALTTLYHYDPFGRRTATEVEGWDGAGLSTRRLSYEYGDPEINGGDARYVKREVNAEGMVVSNVLARDHFGRPIAVENIDLMQTHTAYDTFGRPYFTADETGAYAEMKLQDYVGDGECPDHSRYLQRTEPAGAPASYACFDMLGREVRSASQGFDGRWVYVDMEYDLQGRMLRSSEPYFAGDPAYWTSLEYDLLGRVVSTELPDGSVATANYSGLITTHTNALDQVKTETRNVFGELARVQDHLGGWVEFDYDAQGHLTETRKGDSNVTLQTTRITNDRLGRKVTMDDPDMGEWTYAYNAFGELITQTDAKHQTVMVTYDVMGRMIQRDEWTGSASGLPDTRSNWIYAAGKLRVEDKSERTVDGSGAAIMGAPLLTRTYDYDLFGRPAEVRTDMEGASYIARTTYDQFGRVFQRFDASGSDRGSEHRYNDYGHLEKVIEAQNSASGNAQTYYQVMSADARGNVLHAIKLGASEKRNYDPATGRVETIVGENAAAIRMVDLRHTFDALGNLTSRNDAVQALTETFVYDGLNRLESALVTGSATADDLHLTYDALGNIKTKSDVGNYAYGVACPDEHAGPNALSSAGGKTYCYDANGNMTSRDGSTVTYSIFNKPTYMANGSRSVRIAYGPNRERYSRTDVDDLGTTQTRYVGSVEFIVRPDGTSETKRYLSGGVIITERTNGTSVAEAMFMDHLGSVAAIVAGDGSLVQRMSFDAFGKRRSPDWRTYLDFDVWTYDTKSTTLGFTGHEMLDPLGLVHMNGRVYDPELGRFLSADPFIQDPDITGSHNRYSYVWNNPLSGVDPSGYFLKKLFKNRYVRMLTAAVVGYFTFSAVWNWSTTSGGWALSSQTLTGITTASVNGVQLTASYAITGPVLTAAGAVSAGAFSAATAGFMSGAILTGSLKGAAQGAITGAITGGISAYFGSAWSLKRIAASALGGGVTAEVNGGKFIDGMRLALVSSLLEGAAIKMREKMIAQSRLDPRNASGKSVGFRGDRFKLGGGRFNPFKRKNTPPSPLGCDQGSEGCLGIPLTDKRYYYEVGSWQDYLVEAYAGPHDFLNSRFWYDQVTGNIREMGMAQQFFGEILNAANVVVATPFVAASVAPQFVTNQASYLDDW